MNHSPLTEDSEKDFEIRSLSGISWDELYACHSEAFRDYPFQWSREALIRTVRRRGFDPALSFGAFQNSTLVSFTWNGLGNFNGLKTAYDTGTGTIGAVRNKGLASRIFSYAVPILQSAGVKNYLLEVLAENKSARSVYSRMGFEVSRTFHCFRTEAAGWHVPARSCPREVEFKKIDFSWKDTMVKMHDFQLSWQNNFQALLKEPSHFVVTGAFLSDRLVGYGMIESDGGDIPQLAVSHDLRGKGIGTELMRHLRALNRFGTVKIVNVPSDQEHILKFIKRCGMSEIAVQYEMEKRL